MKTSHVVAFLGGALLGALIALLLAPEKGKDTRKLINDKLKENGINLSKEELDKLIKKIKELVGIKSEQEIIIDDSSEEDDL